MDGIRALGQGFHRSCTSPVGEKGKQLPGTAHGCHEPERMAKGDAPPCMAPSGLIGRILLKFQPKIYERGHIRQPDAAYGQNRYMLHQKKILVIKCLSQLNILEYI